MTLSVTEFRKNLFRALDRAFQGEPVEVLYHGRKLRLVPEEPPSKLARLIKRDTLTIPADQLEKAITDMNQEAMTEWEREWS